LKINRVLVANRSEVSLRIIASCRALGIKTVAIFVSQDAGLSFIYRADEAYKLQKDGSAGYLDQEEIIRIAHKAKVDAIHPGYGFLSENASFAKKVIAAGVLWIGPNPETMLLVGNKINARTFAQNIGVPIIPGFHFEDVGQKTVQEAMFAAKEIGYPVILKDPNRGGGKSIRRVDDTSEFKSAWSAVCLESKASCLSQIILEKCIENARHIEVQIAGDGNQVIHLFERECSIQRRHQKIIEEAPCLFLKKDMLERIHEAAIKIASSVGFKGIGTVEFLATNDGTFYFLEVNPRLQVEHSVTELTTGVDLVALQIFIAETQSLPFCQQDISKKGHAVECRIYSEDPEKNFLPSVGKIKSISHPFGPCIRVDADLPEGHEVLFYFDPMISKVTVFGNNRELAVGHMKNALSQYEISGVKTNILFLKKILNSKAFLNGDIHTNLLQDKKYFNSILSGLKQKNEDLLGVENTDLLQEETAAAAACLLDDFAKQAYKPPTAGGNLYEYTDWELQKWE
jgi:acetyl-CoA carboxylase, biotin carboxylase subunit